MAAVSAMVNLNGKEFHTPIQPESDYGVGVYKELPDEWIFFLDSQNRLIFFHEKQMSEGISSHDGICINKDTPPRHQYPY